MRTKASSSKMARLQLITSSTRSMDSQRDLCQVSMPSLYLPACLPTYLNCSFILDVSICTYAPVSLHLVGMSSDPEVFSVHMNGQVLQQNGHKMSSVGLISGSSTTVSMVAVHTGRWLLSSQIVKHIEGKWLFNMGMGFPVFEMNSMSVSLQVKCMAL